jgi:ribosomal protein S18 acetylase RimI-like enzyme
MQSETMGLFIEAWGQMTGALPSPNHETTGAVTNRLCDAPNLFFNLWIQNQPTSDEEAFRNMLSTGKTISEAWHHPSAGLLCVDWLPGNWEEILREEDLALMLTMTGMHTHEIAAPSHPPADIEIRKITDDKTARDGAMINAHAYHMQESEFECCSGRFFWPDYTVGFVGYRDGEPVTTATARAVNGTVYVAMVATEPAMEKRGYADTVMRHAIEAGRRHIGSDKITLHATEVGQPTYERMGFMPGPVVAMVVPAG